MRENTNFKSQGNLSLNSNKTAKPTWRVSTQTMAQMTNRLSKTMVSRLETKQN